MNILHWSKSKKRDYDITFICRRNRNHFAIPILNELKKKYSIQYLFPEHKRDYHHWQVKGKIIWVEWAHKFAKEVTKKKWKNKTVIIRLHRYEIDTSYMRSITWANVNKLIFVNPELESQFKEKYYKDIETVTIPNAIDVSEFPFNNPTKKNQFLAFSLHFHPVKAYFQLINTFVKVVHKVTDIRLTIATQGPMNLEQIEYFKSCKNLIENHNLKKHIILHKINRNQEILDLLSSHNAIISYSEIESFHYAFAEGLLSGLEGFCRGWRALNPQYFWNDWCFDTEQDFINAILEWCESSSKDRLRKSKFNREYILNNYASNVISNAFEKMLNIS